MKELATKHPEDSMMQRHQENQEFQPGEPGYISPDSTPKRSVLDKIKLFHQVDVEPKLIMP